VCPDTRDCRVIMTVMLTRSDVHRGIKTGLL